MMAASLVGTGSGASAVDSHPLIPSPTHTPSLHEPSSGSTSASNTSSMTFFDEDSEEGGLESDANSLFLTGPKLAVSSPLGLSASTSCDSPPVQEDEKNIALDQLKELDVAIGLRKVNKVDGRKTRWIEYRLKKLEKVGNKVKISQKENKKFDDGQMADRAIADFDAENSLESEIKESKSSKQANLKEKQLKEIHNQPDQLESMSISEYAQINEALDSLNDTNNNNNNNLNIHKMKAEVTCSTSSSVTPFNTSSVIKNMKQQFLEDTSKSLASTLPFPKSKNKKKVTKSQNKLSSLVSNGTFKPKSSGRPKKFKISKVAKETDSLPSVCNVTGDNSYLSNSSDIPDSSSSNVNSENDSNFTENCDKDVSLECSPVKSENSSSQSPRSTENNSISQSTSEFYPRRNLTKGLRGVRKSESENGSPTPKVSPTMPLKIVPLPLSPTPSETGSLSSYKCPLISAAAKALTFPKQTSEQSKKALSKSSKKESTNKAQKSLNGHMTNGSSKYSKEKSSSHNTKVISKRQSFIKKHGRGRSRALASLKWSKKTSTIFADVHNTMNGEPQTVIPVNNPVVHSRKKRAFASSKVSNTLESGKQANGISNVSKVDTNSSKEKYMPTVPNDSSKLSKKSLTSSASRANDITIIESGQLDSTKELDGNSSSDRSELVPELEKTEGSYKREESFDTKEDPSIKCSQDEKENSASFLYSPSSLPSDKSPKSPLGMKSESLKKNLYECRQRTILEFTNALEARGSRESRLSGNYQTNSLASKNNQTDDSDSYEGNNLPETQGIKVKEEPNFNSEETTIAENKINLQTNKKTPCKTPKNKSLNAVIEKLHSPPPKKILSYKDTSLTSEFNNDIPTNGKEGNSSEIPSTFPPESMKPQDTESKPELKPAINEKSVNKSKEKVPRFLRQLFEDEGVQNMLRSMNEDNSNNEGVTNSEMNMHKLRPKRANDPPASESPEPEEFAFQYKRKKRMIEPDSASEDGNLLHSAEALKKSVEDISGNSQKVNKNLTNSGMDGKKRKLNSYGNANLKGSLECKRGKLGDTQDSKDKLSQFKSYKLNGDENNEQPPTKKKVKQNATGGKEESMTYLQILKKRMNKLGIKENMSVDQIREILEKRKKNKECSEPATSVNSDKAEKDSINSQDKGSNHTSIFSKMQTPKVENDQPISNLISPKLNPSSKPNSAPVSNTTEKTFSTSQNNVNKLFKDSSPSSSLPTKCINKSPADTPITMLVRPTEPNGLQKGKARQSGEVLRQSQRTCVRQNEGNNHYRDIQLRRFNLFMHIIMNPSTTKMKNSFNSRVLHELCEALSYLRRDDSIRVVLITATGSTFCQGIDLSSLQHPNQDTKKKNAENLLRGIRDFMRALVQFPKMIIAGVNGDATGLGATMLPLFDMVIASDKAEFFLPYGKLGQVPEGGATYTFPNFFGKLQSTKLFYGHKISAIQANQMGLISETLWPATFLQELIPKVALLASQAAQSMEATKSLMNHHLLTKLELSMESECRILLQQWMTPEFSNLCKKFLETHNIQLQKPVSLPL